MAQHIPRHLQRFLGEITNQSVTILLVHLQSCNNTRGSRENKPSVFLAPFIVGRSNVFKLLLHARHLHRQKDKLQNIISHNSTRGNGHVTEMGDKLKFLKSRDVPPFPQWMVQGPHLPLRLDQRPP